MKEITKDNWRPFHKPAIVFVHTPFCATCQLAEKMLHVLEEADIDLTIHRMNASFFPEFMQKNKIESVPSLLLVKEDVVESRLYAFESVTKLFGVLEDWKQKWSI
ncbi:MULTISPECIES: thioredoxin domain-containing protein [Gracilibacillus]|uniref:thioredoxin domain-containing protein n=1 Tax=Gracilibacillus TaxID=74385 RepID=UPI0006D2C258